MTTITKKTTLLAVPVVLTKVESLGREGVIISNASGHLYGENLAWAEGDRALLKYMDGSEERTLEVGSVASDDPTPHVVLQINDLPAAGTPVTIWWKGASINVTVAMP